MEKWNEIRTAYKLAELKTLSATAQEMGVHRSTVMRHIDNLEEALGVTLFQRNDKGYIATKAGLEVMRLGQVTENQFAQLPNKLKQQEQALTGRLSITGVSDIASMIMPCIEKYQKQHPKIQVEYLGDLRNYKLEYGEADIAIRSGKKPTTPDNIVLPLTQVSLSFTAHKSYIEKQGLPRLDTLSQHRFVALRDRPKHLVWNEWIYQNIPNENIVFKSDDHQVLAHAITKGLGIGVMPKHNFKQSSDFIELDHPCEWQFPIWALVHRDMYNMPKIKAFIELLKQEDDMYLSLI